MNRPNNPWPDDSLAASLWELQAEWHHARRLLLLPLLRLCDRLLSR